MGAYVILDVDVHDPRGYEMYKELAPPTLQLYGGKYLARGGKTEVLEGNWPSNRLVILEFETKEQAKAWLNSPEYAPARSLRYEYAKTNMILVEGL